MKNIIRQILKQIQEDKVKRRRMRAALLVLSLFVASGVLWQLKITGITMTGEALCGYLEHQHSDACVEKTLICELEELPEHSHSEGCYTLEKTLTCQDADHGHTDDCYAETQKLVCTQEETVGHTHGDQCYTSDYICGCEAHVHTVLCYSDDTADVESSRIWEATLPGLTGCTSVDLVRVAQSQVGYTESIQNYKVADDGVTKMGYTRYGEWYGNPYGNWNAMFVSFCLKYAEHPAYEDLKSSGAETMRLAAEDLGYCQDADYQPEAGNLVFFDRNDDSAADAVGVVSGREGDTFTAIEGDYENAVQKLSHTVGDDVILAYAQLPQESEPDAAPTSALALTLSDTGESAAVQTSGSEESEAAAQGETGDTITISFVIDNENYTNDPGSGNTHITVTSTDGLATEDLTYTSWASRYKVTGTGTLVSYDIPANTSLSASGYGLPSLSVENIGSSNTYSYISSRSWITSGKMICNDDTIFSEDTTLYLSLYPSGESYNLNWVCNCTGTSSSAGCHSVYYNLSSSYPNATFALGESLAPNYILSADDVNATYTGNGESCNVGAENNMVFTGWYLKNETTGEETDLAAGVPFLTEHIDPHSSGYTVKVYARWQAADVEMVTATFKNGETVVSTVTLASGTVLGDQLPAGPEAEVGKYFAGWLAEGSTEHATAETVISADTTFTADFQDAAAVTFMVNGEQYGDVVYVAPGSALGILPEDPEYTGEDGLTFLGWTAEGVEGYVTEDTIISASMTLTAAFGEEVGFDVYFHDIDPDGNDALAESSISLLVTENSAVADWLEGDLLDEDTAIADCIWYTIAEDGTKTRYDLSTPVTGELHLYTYSYRLTLTMATESEASAVSSFFLTASAVEIDVNGDTLTLTLREGEKPTAADFVVDGVDYSLYTWTKEDGTPVEISDIIANGVTENITAKSSATDLAITANTDTQHIYFYVIVDQEKKLVQETNLTVYSFGNSDANGRWRISEASLESIYSEYNLDVTAADQYKFAFCSGTNSDADIWNDVPLYEANGMQFVGLETSIVDNVYFYYLPNVTSQTSSWDSRTQWSDYQATNSFYSITIQDDGNIYDSAADVPAVSYVFTGETATVTLQTPGTGETWTKDGVILSGTDNDDGTTTYVFENVTAPIVIISDSATRTVFVSDTANAVYGEGEARPSETVGIGGDVTITVKYNSGYDWLANGKSVPGTVSDDETTVTYTFTNVTEDIVLTPVALKEQVTVNYSIGTLPYENVITSTRPTIKNGATYADTVNLTDSGSYVVLTPDKTQYTRTGNVSLVTVTFKGWDANGDGTVDLKAGQVLTAAELSQYGDTVNLTAVWEDQGYEGSVSFYINLELQVLDYDGSTAETPNSNFTGAVYGTEVLIDPAPATEYQYADVLQAASQSETAAIDAKIRTLTDGVTATYMNAEREFTLMTFPDDENALAQIRQMQQTYITAYDTWATEQLQGNASADTSVSAYRAAGNKIIWDSGTGEYIPWEEITSENYTIRWYVFKYDQTNGWHIDGVLVKKQGQLTITKTFYGNSVAIQEVKNSPYTISVMDGEKAIYTLDLDPEDTSSNTGYVNYDASTDTYTWKIDLATSKTYTLLENNYIVASNVVDGMDMASLAEYMVVNGGDENVSRTTYPTAGITVTAKSYSVDIDYTSYKTVKLYNSYLPTTAMLLRKVDDSGNTLSGVNFQLKKDDSLVQMYKDADGIYYIYAAEDASAVDYITTDAFGQAIIIGLKDEQYKGEYKLVEVAAPTGYAKIDEEMAFTLDENGNLSVDGISSYLELLDDGITLQVTNTSHTMDITVIKQWLDGTDEEVTLQLYLNGAAMSDEYEVVLDGVVDEKETVAWQYTWTNVPAYVGGSLATYTVREEWIGDTAYSGSLADGYENYLVTYADPVYTYDSNGTPTDLTLKVTNRTYTGGVEFTKVNAANAALEGATFQLYTDEACTKTYGSTATSDANGVVSFGNLAAGTYYMKETAAPAGYQSNDNTYVVTVSGSGTTINVLGSDTAITTISNIPANANLLVQKTDDQGNALTGATFELYKQNADDGWDKVIIDGKTSYTVDDNGQINFTDLENGEYKLVETSAPSGYYRLTEEIYFTVSLGEVSCNTNRSTTCWTFIPGNPATITVVNVPGSELPHTGGMGTHFGTMVGLLMMAGSLLYGFLLRRKRERGAV